MKIAPPSLVVRPPLMVRLLKIVGAAAGFTQLIPAGTQIKVGATTYTLERA